jgi:acetylornithine deacetylase/succinyl-diaminopimelate desuccinylase-like protein
VSSDLSDVYAYIDAHADESIAELQRLLRQPSVAAQGHGMAETASIVEAMLRSAGFEPRQVPTAGFPVVYAEKPGATGKVLSFYNHYDVQPADPLDEWDSDPWAAEIRDGRIWARGVADNKGNIAARVAAMRAWQVVRGQLPLTVKFIIEGEEEISSPSLMDFAVANPDLCAADACIWEFGGRDIDGRPQIHLGLKGICYVELRAKGARIDWHSSVATSVPNPAWRLIWALNAIKGNDGRVNIPGFYDSVKPPTEDEIEALKKLPDYESMRLEDLGIPEFLEGRTGLELHMHDYFQPTCTVSGFLSGYIGEGAKTVLPSRAKAKLDMRLVADQDPFTIHQSLRAFLDEHGFHDIESELLGAQYPSRTPSDAPIAKVVEETYEELYGQAPVVYATSQGSGPWHQLCGQYGIDACTAGVGHAKSRAHAPNENIYVDDFILGIKHICTIMDRYAEQGADQ